MRTAKVVELRLGKRVTSHRRCCSRGSVPASTEEGIDFVLGESLGRHGLLNHELREVDTTDLFLLLEERA